MFGFALGSLQAFGTGHAKVEWITASATSEPGKPLQTAIRMSIEPGWHTYWINPGEGGMKTGFEWKLPPGWLASEPGHPVPKRFLTGELPGFGYKGIVMFPVTLTAPAGFEGSAKLTGKISWLACNEGACVPGEAEITLEISAGAMADSADAPQIQAALALIPQPQDDVFEFQVAEAPQGLTLSIKSRSRKAINPGQWEVFPATPEVVDPAAEIRFVAKGAEWTAGVPKSEYLTGPPQALKLVIAQAGEAGPISLTWRAP